jgi:pimeloyl-ACP methyl ester carboxylesterase
MDITRTASYKVWESADRTYLFARWSYKPATRALVFVHGLASGWDTWIPYRHIVEQPGLDHTDVFWFDYSSLGTTIPRSSYWLNEAFGEVLDASSPLHAHYSRPAGRPPQPYDCVDIVAHSLGAVVARTALTLLANDVRKAGTETVPWKIRQLLLAPALIGSKLPYLIKYVGTESFVAGLQFVLGGGVSAIMDLREGSDLLKRLENTVKDRLKEHRVVAEACGLHVALTSHGERDHVVIQNTYALDDNYDLLPDDHFTIIPSAVVAHAAFVGGSC